MAYFTVLRERILSWGADASEVASALPGDDLLPNPNGSSTRAITIDAPPEAVWPWIAQLGPAPRGGAYTYDWIENLLGLNMHSVDRVLSEFQHPSIGDEISFGANTMRAELIDPPHSFAWLSADGNWLWSFTIEPSGSGSRLISRNRYALPRLMDQIGMLPMEAGSLVMERKMLKGIKSRAESE